MWFLKDLGRLNAEREAIEVLEAENDWLDGVQFYLGPRQLTVDATITVDAARRYPLRLTFPDLYPSAPASVCPQDQTLDLSDHQYLNGDLCLELGPDNWHPDSHNAAQLLESAYRLLSLEVEQAADEAVDIPSRHALTTGQAMRTKYLRWVVTPEVRAALNALPDGSSYRCDVIDLFHEESITAFLQKIERADGVDNWCDPNVPVSLKNPGRRVRGVIVTRPIGALTLAQIDQPDVLTTLLHDPAVPDSQDSDADNDLSSVTYVFHKSFGGVWQAHCRWSAGEKVWSTSAVDTDTDGAAIRHGLDAERLAKVNVAIVGLGSIGGKIAASLARSGVRQFFLLDDDLLHPANLARNELDWSDVGQHKVDAVADRLLLLHPDMKIVRRRHRLRGQESSASAASALSALAQADLIIDATASPSVYTLCAHVVRQAKKPLVWMEVFAGGIGGLVARSRPDNDAEPFTLRAAIHNAANEIAEQKGVEAPEAAVNYGAEVGDEIVTASDADVSVLAAHGTQIALDTLLARSPSRFRHPAYLVGFSAEWIFEEAFHTIPIDCSAPIDWSTTVKTDKATRERASAFIVKLLEDLSADADSKAST